VLRTFVCWTGRGCYASDRFPSRLCHAALVRSPHPHARIRSIDTARAGSLPGVLAILTGRDAAMDGLGPIPHNPEWTGRPDAELRVPPDFEVFLTPNPPLSTETVRYVGEPVALVVAGTRALAADAAEQVEVDWEPLPAVAAARDALDPDRPRAKHALDTNFVGGDIGQMRPRNGSRGCERSGTALRQRSGAQGQH